MKIQWKTFRKSFPYICTNCGEFSNMEREYCEQCGTKDSFRSTTLEDYENNRASKLGENYYKINDKPVNGVIDTREPKKFKFGYVILIIISAILIIDLIGFFLIMNILNIPLDEIGNTLPIFYILLGFSLVMLVLLIICIYAAYYRGKLRDILLI